MGQKFCNCGNNDISKNETSIVNMSHSNNFTLVSKE